ncbi:MAG TPA: hypothetical protein PLZ84_08840, partial [Clostridia bacterium]|nr:hypothetical protein [Clostridia bacterium]
FVTVPFQGAYSMSKYALEAFNEALVMECSRYGICSVIIDPGDMKTGFTGARRYTAGAARTQYRPYFDYAVHTMVKDEQNGSSPEACAQAAVKAITGKRRNARIIIGFSYKLVNILRRLLPLKLTLKIVNYVYSRPIENDELWSFDRDVKGKCE